MDNDEKPEKVRPLLPRASFDSGNLHHLSMFLVDIENHGARPDKVKGVLRAELRRIVTAAMAHAGVSALQPPDDAGDSLCFLFGPGTPKNRLIDPLIPVLTRELLAYNAVALPCAHMRLRVVVDCGELYRDEHKFYGSGLNDAYGLLNSNELREGLRRHLDGPVVVMVSREIYDGVVRYASGDIDPSGYLAVTVLLKQGIVEAWMHGPREDQPQK